MLKAAVFIAVIDLEVLIANTRKLSYLALASKKKCGYFWGFLSLYFYLRVVKVYFKSSIH